MGSTTAVGNIIISCKNLAWQECEAELARFMSDEPKSYKMTEASLLEMNEEDWKNIWEEHKNFHDMTLKKACFNSSFKYRAITESYIEQMHLKLKSIMLERRMKRLEKMLNLN